MSRSLPAFVASATAMPLLAFVLLAGVSSAQEPAGGTSASTTSTTSAPASGTATPGQPSSDSVRRDPKGIKGISPMWEAVNRGDAAFLARDFPGALSEYTAAVKADPKNPVGHLRLAQLHFNQGRLADAQESIVLALRFVGDRLVYRSQAFYLLAMVREAQNAPDDAIDSWSAYEALAPEATTEAPDQKLSPEQAAKAPAPAKTYTETAADRKRMLAKQKQLEQDYAPVKARIEQNLKAAEEAAKK